MSVYDLFNIPKHISASTYKECFFFKLNPVWEFHNYNSFEKFLKKSDQIEIFLHGARLDDRPLNCN